MKRFLVLLLGLCLLLGGCVSQRPSVTAEPTELPKPPADALVQTDYSQYTPREALSPKYIPAEEPCYDLVASEDYGGIYPYAGASVRTELGGSRYQFGMVDARGQILTEPVYDSVKLLEAWVDYDKLPEVYPYWILQKKIVGENYDYGYLCAVATLDGSVVTECIYSNISWGDGYILALDTREEMPRFDIFDTEMKLYRRSEEIPALEQIPKNYLYYLSAELSDGMLLLRCSHENGQMLCYYTDLQGETLLGPYATAESFSDGIAIVQDSYDTYGIIDKRGETCFPHSFTYFDGFHQGVAVMGDRNGMRSLVDREGKIILREKEGQTLYREYDLYGLVEDGVVNFYNARGELVCTDIPYNWSHLGRGIFSDWKYELIDGKTQKRFTVTRAEDAYHYPYPLWDYGYECIIVADNSGSETISYLVNEELEVLERVDGTIDVLTGAGKTILYMKEGQELRFCDSDLQTLFSCTLPVYGYVSAELCADRILICWERYCLHYSLNGELLFCYHLPSFGDD